MTVPAMRPPWPTRCRRLLGHPLFAALILALAGPAVAQDALERHLPSPPQATDGALTLPRPDDEAASRAPLWVTLIGIHLLGAKDPVAVHPGAGVTGTVPGIAPTPVEAALAPFLGQPLSLDLAGKAQAAIAAAYREAGYPFVSVTLPPQEVTAGVLQIRIIEFRLGTVTVEGARGGPQGDEATGVRAGLRVSPGSRIDARALDEDLGWINRSPYRRAQGAFRPGEALGLSDLRVTLNQSGRPWTLSFGVSNAGAAATGRGRYSLGFGARLGPDDWLSYQLTGSDDLWQHPGRILPSDGDYPRYLSHALRFNFGIAPRQAFEIAPAYVASRERPDTFTTYETATFELPVIWRTTVSNLLPGRYRGDLYGGVEFKRTRRNTFFAGTPVAAGSAGLFQMVLGWSDTIAGNSGRTAIDLRVKANPGGIVEGNDTATWSSFSNGRVSSVRYGYAALDLDRTWRLGGGAVWHSHLSAIFTGRPLPDSERLSLGGLDAVRGYNFDDASVDTGAIWRNEYRLSAMSLGEGGAGRLHPFLFVDMAKGKDHASGASTTLVAHGFGFDSATGPVSASLTVGQALKRAGNTEAHDWTVLARLTARF